MNRDERRTWMIERTTNPSLDDDDSQHTILRPSDSATSDLMSVFGGLMVFDEADIWRNRKHFFFKILSFCLGLGNLWRFPRHALLHGNATFVYLYIMYSLIFGTSLICFELALGQYMAKGFSRIFALCPLLEGVTLSMVFYSILVNMMYNMVSVYSLMYGFSSFFYPMPHSVCLSTNTSECRENATTQTSSSEYIYFYHYTVKGLDIDSEVTKHFNARNAGLLFLIWAIICCMIIFGVVKYHWVPVILCIVIVLGLVITAIAGVTLKGADVGLKNMFIPHKNDLMFLSTWIAPLEQAIISIGVGAGPLIVFWSHTKYKRWNFVDCTLANIIVVICTMLSGIIMFSAAGVIAHGRNLTINDTFYLNSTADIQIHIIVTQMLNKLGFGLSNFITAVFYYTLFTTSLFCGMELTQTVILFFRSVLVTKKHTGLRLIIGVCFANFCLELVMATRQGYQIMMSIDDVFLGLSVVLIIICEMVSVVYFYGLRNFCDDIEFLLGFIPNYFFQVSWLLLPVWLLVQFVGSMYLKCTVIKNPYDLAMIYLGVLLIVMPVITRAIWRCGISINAKRERSRDTSLEMRSMQSTMQ